MVVARGKEIDSRGVARLRERESACANEMREITEAFLARVCRLLEANGMKMNRERYWSLDGEKKKKRSRDKWWVLHISFI